MHKLYVSVSVFGIEFPKSYGLANCRIRSTHHILFFSDELNSVKFSSTIQLSVNRLLGFCALLRLLFSTLVVFDHIDFLFCRSPLYLNPVALVRESLRSIYPFPLINQPFLEFDLSGRSNTSFDYIS